MVESNKDIKVKKHNSPNQTDNIGGRPWILDWSDDVVIEELKDMLKKLKSDDDIIYIWELFLEKDYSRSSFIQQVSNRKANEELSKVYNTIKEILETRAVKWLLGNTLNATWTIFHLKNNYQWVDKVVNENTNTNLDYEAQDKDEFKDLLKNNWLI